MTHIKDIIVTIEQTAPICINGAKKPVFWSPIQKSLYQESIKEFNGRMEKALKTYKKY